MSSEAFLQSFPPPKHETVHKVFTRPRDGSDMGNEKDSSSSSASDENQSFDENSKGYILVTGGFKSDNKEDDSDGE